MKSLTSLKTDQAPETLMVELVRLLLLSVVWELLEIGEDGSMLS